MIGWLNESLMYAIEGQKLCKCGKCLHRIVYFEKALNKETNNSYITKAIYKAMGNADYYLQHYHKVTLLCYIITFWILLSKFVFYELCILTFFQKMCLKL